MDCSWWLYQCLVLELTDLMSSILPWSPWRISSLSAVLSGYANVCVRKLRVGEFKSFNSFNRHSSVQIYNEKKKNPNWRTSLPITDLLDFLSDLISPEGNEKHCPLHHFTLQTKKDMVKEFDKIPISSLPPISLTLCVPVPTVSGCSSRSSISLKSTII